MEPSGLIRKYLAAIRRSGDSGPVLDLACGSGRNGAYLVHEGLHVVFADRRAEQLAQIARHLQGSDLFELWQVDLEQAGSEPLAGRSFGAILVFRYLHRPLLAALRDAVEPGGLVVYETYTVDQPRFGRPHNPEFLLRPRELHNTFRDWDVLHSFEGVTTSDTSGHEQAIAQVVARRPVASEPRDSLPVQR